MLDRYNRNLRDGLDVLEAAKEAGIARFRAIMLTSITTVAGLYPLILEKSFQAQFIIPMAISLAYGVLFGTLFILFFFPVVIVCFNDIKVYVTWFFNHVRNYFMWLFSSDQQFETPKPMKREVEPAIVEKKRLQEN
jgi:predicted RND superfamily exporter protein